MEQSSPNRVVYRKDLTGLSDTLFRFVLALLVGSDRLWATLAVGIPIGSLLASGVNTLFARVAVGASIAVALWLVWMSHEFISCRTTFDVDSGNFVKSKPYGDGDYPAARFDKISRVTIIRFGTAALVKFDYTSALSNNTPAVVIDNSDIAAFVSHLEHFDIEVKSRSVNLWSAPTNRIHFRIITGPVILIGVPVVVWLLYGIDPFKSNVVIVPLIALVLFWTYGLVR